MDLSNLIDRVVDEKPGESVSAFTKVTRQNCSEYPGFWAMPSATILQIMELAVNRAIINKPAQAVILVGVDDAHFNKNIQPGNEIRTDVKISSSVGLRHRMFADVAVYKTGNDVPFSTAKLTLEIC